MDTNRKHLITEFALEYSIFNLEAIYILNFRIEQFWIVENIAGDVRIILPQKEGNFADFYSIEKDVLLVSENRQVWSYIISNEDYLFNEFKNDNPKRLSFHLEAYRDVSSLQDEYFEYLLEYGIMNEDGELIKQKSQSQYVKENFTGLGWMISDFANADWNIGTDYVLLFKYEKMFLNICNIEEIADLESAIEVIEQCGFIAKPHDEFDIEIEWK